MMVEYDKDARVTREEAAQVKQQIIADFTGENVGAVGVLSPGGKASQMGFSPADMDLTALHRLPEERIAAVGYDIQRARALQQDMDALYKRITEAVGGPWLLPDEGRGQVGLEPLTPEQAVLLAAQRPQRALSATTAPGEGRGLELVERRAG